MGGRTLLCAHLGTIIAENDFRLTKVRNGGEGGWRGRFRRAFAGVATSGHQTEGGNALSDTWFLEHARPTVFRETSGQACNGYERWREDVDLLAGLGLDTYRFSVEWGEGRAGRGAVLGGGSGALSRDRRLLPRARAAGCQPSIAASIASRSMAGVPAYHCAAGGITVPGTTLQLIMT